MSLETKWTAMNEEGKNITTLQELIRNTIETEIVTKTYIPNQKIKITDQDIKKAKSEMKHRKKSFQRSCRNYKDSNENKQLEKELYV